MRHRAAVMLLMALILTGCRERRRPGRSPAAMRGAHSIIVPLEEKDSSGMTGSVTLTPVADSLTAVEVAMRPPADEPTRAHTHPVRIHTGRCEYPADVVAVLTGLRDEGRGTVRSRSLVSLPLSALTDGRHVVAVHTALGPPGMIVACAQLGASPSPSSGQSPATAPAR